MASNLIYQYYLPFTGPDKGVIKEESNGYPFWANLGVASARKYASSIDVQYELSTKVTIHAPNQNLEACRVFLDPYFDKFDKVLMLDIDTLVNTKENIFNQKIKDIGMIQDGGPGSPQKFIRNVIGKLESYGEITFKKSKTFPDEKRYLNGGVVLWSKPGRLKARKLWGGMLEMQKYRSTLKMNEQPYLNLMINKHDMDVTELSNQWNRMNYMWPFGIPDGKINHFLAKSKIRMKEFI